MEKGTLGRLALIIALATSVGAAGCFLGEEETTAGSDEVVAGGETSAVLRSTLILDIGCTAAKVGPRHLLLAARCIADKPEIAPGKTISFRAASELRSVVAGDTEDDVLEATDTSADEEDEAPAGETADEAAGDAGEAGALAGDAGSPAKKSKGDREVTIEEVEIHPSYTAKCAGDACDFGAIGAGDAKDIAVLILDADLESVPTVPIDLDAVGQSDRLLAVGSGCEKLDGSPSGVKTFKTIAVPAKSVNHAGSPYIEDPARVSRLAAGYVVTPGVGWRPTEPRICKSDIGAPLFRGGQAAVAGITSNFTMFDAESLVPVTLHHTKVDAASKVGTWLETLGVETTHSCSEAIGGCVKKGYDGGAPGVQAAPKTDNGTAPGADAGDEVLVPGDAGDAGEAETDPDAGPVSDELPDQGEEAELPESSEDEYYPSGESSDDYSDWDAGPKKKKKKKASGCAAAPGSMPSGGDGMVLVLGVALAGAIVRRRRDS